jgi:hypothetical protein
MTAGAHKVEFLGASELLEQAQDRTWLAKVTNALNQHWQMKKCHEEKLSCKWFAKRLFSSNQGYKTVRALIFAAVSAVVQFTCLSSAYSQTWTQ